jgi:hypothetical protein
MWFIPSAVGVFMRHLRHYYWWRRRFEADYLWRLQPVNLDTNAISPMPA